MANARLVQHSREHGASDTDDCPTDNKSVLKVNNSKLSDEKEICTPRGFDNEIEVSKSGQIQVNSIKTDSTHIAESDRSDIHLRSSKCAEIRAITSTFCLVKELVWIVHKPRLCDSKTKEVTVCGKGEEFRRNDDETVINPHTSPLDSIACKTTSRSSRYTDKQLSASIESQTTKCVLAAPHKKLGMGESAMHQRSMSPINHRKYHTYAGGPCTTNKGNRSRTKSVHSKGTKESTQGYRFTALNAKKSYPKDVPKLADRDCENDRGQSRCTGIQHLHRSHNVGVNHTVTGVPGGFVKNAFTTGVVYGDVGNKNVSQVFQPGSMITKNQIVSEHVTITGGVKVDKYVTNMQAQTYELLEIACTPFVETTGYLEAKSCIESFGRVILIGEAGSGKTTIGYRLLKLYNDWQSFTPLIVDDVDDLKHLRDPNQPTLLFVDDIFGRSAYSASKLQTWLPVLNRLQKTFNPDKLRIIFSSRNYIFIEALPDMVTFQDFMFYKNVQVDLSGDTTLLQSEKEKLILVFAERAGVSIKDDDLKSIVEMKTAYGFPHACYLFSKMKQWHTRPLQFFKKPVDIMIESVQHLSRYDKNKFAVLLLVLLSDGKFNLAKLRKDDEMLHAVHDYTSFQRISELATRRHEISSPLIGSYLTSTRDTLSFRHPTVEDTVAYVVGNIDPLFLIQHCSMQVLYERVRIHSSTGQGSTEPTQPDTQWFHVILSDDYNDDLVNRFMAEFEKDCFALVCLHRACSDMNFVCKLSAALHKHDQSYKEKIFHKEDRKYRQTFLQWSVMNNTEALCEILLKETQFSLVEKNDAMITCCVTGNSRALERLINTLDPLGKRLLTKLRVRKLDMMVLRIQDTDETIIKQTTASQYNLMHVACYYGHTGVVDVLINSGFSVHVSADFDSPLHCCCATGHVSVLSLLVHHGANLETKHSYWQETPLHVCCQFGHIAAVKRCVSLGANIEARNVRKKTPLLIACHFGHDHIAEYLIEEGANIEVIDCDGSTPLIEACICGHFKMVQNLVKKGPNLEARNYNDRTPLMEACVHGHVSVVDFLIENGASTEDVDGQLLSYACQGGCLNIAKRLLENLGSCVQRLQCERNSRLLHCLSMKTEKNRAESKYTIAKLLIDKGADVNAVDEENMTPLMIAAESGYGKLAQFFLEKGTSVFVKDNDGQTLFHKVATGNMASIINMLVSHRTPFSLGDMSEVQNISQSSSSLSNCFENQSTSFDSYSHLSSNGKESLAEICQIRNLPESDVKMLVNTKDAKTHTPLHIAAKIGNKASLKVLLEVSSDINAINTDKQTSLHLATQRQNIDTIRVLLDYGADVNSSDVKMRTPLHEAAKFGTVDIVQLLLDKQANVNAVDHTQCTPLHEALYSQKNDLAIILLSNGADVDVRDDRGQTPLHVAADYGNNETLEKLLEMKVALDIKNDCEQTPLHLASMRPTADNVKILVSHKADVNAVDVYGMTPLHHAAMLARADSTQVLLENKADVDAVDNNKQTSLHLAAKKEIALYTAYVLLLNNADVNAKDSNGQTPLHVAASRCCSVDTVQLLLDNKADVCTTDDKHQTSLHTAADKADEVVIQLLLKYKAEVNAMDLKQQTPLHIAVTRALDTVHDLFLKEAELNIDLDDVKKPIHFIVDIIQVLLNNQADINAVDDKNQTPLHLAIRDRRPEIVQVLLNNGADTNTLDERKRTALHVAVMSQRLDVVKLITYSTVDVNALDENGETPLHLAAGRSGTDISQLLLDSGADVNTKNVHMRTALHRATTESHIQIQVLLDSNADVNVKDENGMTPLHLAAMLRGSVPVNILLKNEADVNMKNVRGQTPLHLAAEKGYVQNVELMLNNIRDVNVRDDMKHTPLHMASKGEVESLTFIVDQVNTLTDEERRRRRRRLLVKKAKSLIFRHADTCQILLKFKADVNAKDVRNKTPLHLAAETGNSDVVQVLLDNGADVSAVDDQMDTPIQLAQQLNRTDIVDVFQGIELHDNSENEPVLALPP